MEQRSTNRRVARELVTILEACQRAKVCRRTIYVWMKKKKIHWVRTAGGSVRIYADTLIKPEPTPESPP